MKIKIGLFLLFGLLLANSKIFSQDPNFQIYLCIGQSNMEGAAKAEAQEIRETIRGKMLSIQGYKINETE